MLQTFKNQPGVAEICRQNNLVPRTVYNWKDAFLAGGRSSFEGKDAATASKHHRKEVADLKRLVGEYAVANAALKKRVNMPICSLFILLYPINLVKWKDYSEKAAESNIHYRRFVDAINRESTLKTYTYDIRTFMRFVASKGMLKGEHDYAGLAGLDPDAITDALEVYVRSLKKRVKPATIRAMLAPVELFLDMNRLSWHKRLVHKSIGRDEEKAGGGKAVTDEEVGSILQAAKHPRSRALVHFLASTGIRVGALADPVLRMRHLSYLPNPQSPTRQPNWCYCVTIYEGSREEYWAFLTPEATKALDSYFWWRRNIRREEINGESPVFASIGTNTDAAHLSVSGAKSVMKTLVRNASVNRTKKGGRYDKAQTYMFRKRFNGKLKMENSVNSNIAEKLMAHKRGLDGVYLRPTMEECYAEFVKAIPALTVDPAERQDNAIEAERQKRDIAEARNEELREQLRKSREQKKEMDILKRKVTIMERAFGRHEKKKYEVDEDLEGKTIEEFLAESNERDRLKRYYDAEIEKDMAAWRHVRS